VEATSHKIAAKNHVFADIRILTPSAAYFVIS